MNRRFILSLTDGEYFSVDQVLNAFLLRSNLLRHLSDMDYTAKCETPTFPSASIPSA